MADKKHVAAFINEYEALCRKYELYLDLTGADTLDIFKVDHHLDFLLAEWRVQNES